MRTLLQEAGREFLKAFLASLIVLLPGVLAATNLNNAFALGVAALFAAFAAGLKAVQVLVPKLSFASLISNKVTAAWLDAFSRAAIGAFLVSIISFLNTPDYTNVKALAVAAIVGAVSAGVRALEGLVTKGEFPFSEFGA